MSKNRFTDPSSLCAFTFADGRRCRTPRLAGHARFCFFHARREARFLASHQLGRDLSSYLSNSYVSACDLSSALGRLIPAVARGDINPKAASSLAYLCQILLQSIQHAEHEYTNAFGTDSWRGAISAPFAPPPAPALPQSAPQPTPQPVPQPIPEPIPQTAPQPAPQPAKAPNAEPPQSLILQSAKTPNPQSVNAPSSPPTPQPSSQPAKSPGPQSAPQPARQPSPPAHSPVFR
jgi:hypothetical protein